MKMVTRYKTKRESFYDEETHHWETRWIEVPYYRYSEEEKIRIVSEHVQGKSAQKIIEEYHLSGKQVLFNWMNKFLHEESLPLPKDENKDNMAKKSIEERVKELEAENRRLEKALELEKLRAKAYDTMINVAEETFNIPIRKKSGTKQ